MKVTLAIAVAMISALLVALWRLARTGNLDQAVMTGGGVFVAVFTMAFMVMTYLSGD
ncbi:hypothetical protein [Streptomyces panaciradicis]|uniref:hypothetical protein n=1 Tax=Streptomyces panaciradicis TaxID=1470261 RepID=UPI00201D1C0C|nr:hypothetical protein [Streptomyces panaciradicis]MCL6669592.1 hypothetical protein [Streptomyces panaciradicis]